MGNTNLTTTFASQKKSSQTFIIATAFLSIFAIVGFALYGLPFFYDSFSKEFGWSRTIVTSGNALGKLLVAPLFCRRFIQDE
jgi:ABC-type multidrug transport system permease subunit